MREQIMRHLEIYREVKKSGLPWEFIKQFGENEVMTASRRINQCGISSQVVNIGKKASAFFIKDVDFCSHVRQLTQKGIPEMRMGKLMEEAEEKLSPYTYEEVGQVLSDAEIPGGLLFAYLKYYSAYGLGGQKKKSLMDGLINWERYAGRPLSETAEAERRLLWQPALAGGMLREVMGEKKVWKYLREDDVLLLLNYMTAKSCGVCLDQDQFFQLAEHPGMIRKGLESVLGFIEEGQAPGFFKLWLCNRALAYDLKKLAERLPGMTKEQIRQTVHSRAAYISVLYQAEMTGFDLEGLTQAQEEILVYAITRHKKHFLSLVRENFEDFRCIPDSSLLLDPAVYRSYLNLNILSLKDLKDCFAIERMGKAKKYMAQDSYTFGEIKTLAPLSAGYVMLYHCLQYKRSDDRLRVIREAIKKKCIPPYLDQGQAELLGEKLSQKPLSQWMQDSLSHIRGLRPATVIKLLLNWEAVSPFIKGASNNNQLEFLVRNRERLERFRDFEDLGAHLEDVDGAWQWLKEEMGFNEMFVQKNHERIRKFLYAGGSEILYSFCRDGYNEQKEKARRLLSAELLGKFREVKYHKGDLEKEIAYPVADAIEAAWRTNLGLKEGCLRVWEEDRFLPVMEIGEKPTSTCMSYRDGVYKDCLLSCFDSNKKVIFMEMDGETVFRAVIRLTKGSFSRARDGEKTVEFVDLMKKAETGADGSGKEELVLFVERPYFKGISKMGQAVALLVQMVRQKAAALRARLVLGKEYQPYLQGHGFVRTEYYVYISASKNGSQYLDSLGGEATRSTSERYYRGTFWVEYGGGIPAS